MLEHSLFFSISFIKCSHIFFSIGMLIASLALLSAGLVEVYRIRNRKLENNTISDMTVTGHDISIFYQIPQFGLMGISEVFVMITGEY